MRIVSLLSSATEILFALGLGEQVLAVSHECNYPPAAARLPQATRSLIDSSKSSAAIDEQVKALVAKRGTLYDLDLRLLRELRPDLIVTQSQCDVCAVRYEDVVAAVYREPALRHAQVLAQSPRSLADVLDDVLKLGEATGTWNRAIELNERLWQRYSDIRLKTEPERDVPRPPVAVVEWTDPLMIAGHWTPDLVRAAGGRSVLATACQPSDYAAWPDFVAAQPEVLIVAPCGFDLARAQLEAERLTNLPEFERLPAVARGRAFVVDGSAYLNRPGPRLLGSLEIVAHLIRPDLFPPPTGELAEGRAWSRL